MANGLLRRPLDDPPLPGHLHAGGQVAAVDLPHDLDHRLAGRALLAVASDQEGASDIAAHQLDVVLAGAAEDARVGPCHLVLGGAGEPQAYRCVRTTHLSGFHI
jgi:hypothetical protein